MLKRAKKWISEKVKRRSENKHERSHSRNRDHRRSRAQTSIDTTNTLPSSSTSTSTTVTNAPNNHRSRLSSEPNNSLEISSSLHSNNTATSSPLEQFNRPNVFWNRGNPVDSTEESETNLPRFRERLHISRPLSLQTRNGRDISTNTAPVQETDEEMARRLQAEEDALARVMTTDDMFSRRLHELDQPTSPTLRLIELLAGNPLAGPESHVFSRHRPHPLASPSMASGLQYLPINLGSRAGGPEVILRIPMRQGVENDFLRYLTLLLAQGAQADSHIQGADQETIDKNTSIRKIQGLESWPEDERSCVICMIEYSNGDSIRQLGCSHFFHDHCGDRWLHINQTCPVCRKAIRDEGEENTV